MFRIVVLLVAGLACLWAGAAHAQEAVLLQLYDKGVHEYFSGDYAQAFNQLTAAIASGSRDPRVYYFRGLAYLKLGRTGEAEMDFRKGADLESRDVNKYYNVVGRWNASRARTATAGSLSSSGADSRVPGVGKNPQSPLRGPQTRRGPGIAAAGHRGCCRSGR